MSYQSKNKIKKLIAFVFAILMLLAPLSNAVLATGASNATEITTQDMNDLRDKLLKDPNDSQRIDAEATFRNWVMGYPDRYTFDAASLQSSVAPQAKSAFETSTDKESWRSFYNSIKSRPDQANIVPNLVQSLRTEFEGNVQTIPEIGSVAEGIGDAKLNKNHTIHDLYPSFIFATSGNKFAGAKDFSATEIAKYPMPMSEHYGNVKEIYGKIIPSVKGTSYVGNQFASYLETLFGYNWLQTQKVNEGGGWFSKIINTFGSILWGMFNALSTAIVAMFEAIDIALEGLFDIIGNVFAKFNVVAFFTPALDKSLREDGVFNKFFGSTLNAIGLSPENFMLIRNIALILLYGALAVLLIKTVREGKHNKGSRSPLARTGIRIFTILVTIPVAISLKGFADDVANYVEGALGDNQEALQDSYVVDTLEWATTLNLSLAPIAPDSTFSDSSIKINQQAEPTTENISIMNQAIKRYGANIIYLDKSDEVPDVGNLDNRGKRQREAVMSKIANSATLNVDAYFARLASMGSGSNIPAASHVGGGSDISLGYEVPGYKPHATANSKTYMFYGKTGENAIGNELDLGTLSGETEARKSWWDKVKESVKNFFNPSSNPNPDNTLDPAAITNTLSLSNANGESRDLEMPGFSKMAYAEAAWNNPYAYLYGSVSSRAVNASSGVKHNYLGDPSGGPDFGQNLNPVTMDLAGDPEGDDDNAKLQRLLDTNALALAAMNRYNGISNITFGNSRTFSNQTVAFLLQTYKTNGVYKYIGKNVPTSLQSGTANHGTDYVGFQQYIIPHANKVDYGMKFFTLSTTVILSALISMIAIYVLLTSPILKSIVSIITNIAKALFTGNLASLFVFGVYYLALRLTIVFIDVTKIIMVGFGNFLLQLMPTISAAMGMFQTGKSVIGAMMGQLMSLLLAIGMAYLLAMPLLRIPSKHGVKDASITEAIISLPLTLAVILEQKLTDLFNRAFGIKGGKGKSQVGMADGRSRERFNTKGRAAAALIGAAGGFAGAKIADKLAEKKDLEKLRRSRESLNEDDDAENDNIPLGEDGNENENTQGGQTLTGENQGNDLGEGQESNINRDGDLDAENGGGDSNPKLGGVVIGASGEELEDGDGDGDGELKEGENLEDSTEETEEAEVGDADELEEGENIDNSDEEKSDEEKSDEEKSDEEKSDEKSDEESDKESRADENEAENYEDSNLERDGSLGAVGVGVGVAAAAKSSSIKDNAKDSEEEESKNALDDYFRDNQAKMSKEEKYEAEKQKAILRAKQRHEKNEERKKAINKALSDLGVRKDPLLKEKDFKDTIQEWEDRFDESEVIYKEHPDGFTAEDLQNEIVDLEKQDAMMTGEYNKAKKEFADKSKVVSDKKADLQQQDQEISQDIERMRYEKNSLDAEIRNEEIAGNSPKVKELKEKRDNLNKQILSSIDDRNSLKQEQHDLDMEQQRLTEKMDQRERAFASFKSGSNRQINTRVAVLETMRDDNEKILGGVSKAWTNESRKTSKPRTKTQAKPTSSSSDEDRDGGKMGGGSGNKNPKPKVRTGSRGSGKSQPQPQPQPKPTLNVNEGSSGSVKPPRGRSTDNKPIANEMKQPRGRSSDDKPTVNEVKPSRGKSSDNKPIVNEVNQPKNEKPNRSKKQKVNLNKNQENLSEPKINAPNENKSPNRRQKINKPNPLNQGDLGSDRVEKEDRYESNINFDDFKNKDKGKEGDESEK